MRDGVARTQVSIDYAQSSQSCEGRCRTGSTILHWHLLVLYPYRTEHGISSKCHVPNTIGRRIFQGASSDCYNLEKFLGDARLAIKSLRGFLDSQIFNFMFSLGFPMYSILGYLHICTKIVSRFMWSQYQGVANYDPAHVRYLYQTKIEVILQLVLA